MLQTRRKPLATVILVSFKTFNSPGSGGSRLANVEAIALSSFEYCVAARPNVARLAPAHLFDVVASETHGYSRDRRFCPDNGPIPEPCGRNPAENVRSLWEVSGSFCPGSVGSRSRWKEKVLLLDPP